jgi:peptide/nickel transport system substrate-binding protein
MSASRAVRTLVVALSLALVASACSGSGGGSGDDGAADAAEATTSTEPEAELEPVTGGRLVIGVDADTARPWTPAKMTCAAACHMTMGAIFEPLAAANADGVIEPYLAESITPNADFTEWTVVPRAGITFHDGTPFDAAAIKFNVEQHLSGFLTSKALANVASIDVEGDAVVFRMHGPWATFGNQLDSQPFWMASPTWLAAAAADPQLEDEPVGTGPFVFKSYEAGGSFVATRTPTYWRADEGLPYLDEIEFRILTDTNARVTALETGDIDLLHTANGSAIAKLRELSGVTTNEDAEYNETSLVLINNGLPDSPVSDRRVRIALAAAIDRDALIERRHAGVHLPANGPFSPSQLGHLDDTGYPDFDPARAKELVEEYLADTGADGVHLTFTTVNDPEALGTAELLQQFWSQVGIDVELTTIEQSALIISVLNGNFELSSFRNFSGIDPDRNRFAWDSETIVPVGAGLSLNFGRVDDQVIDDALDVIRADADTEHRRAAAETINRRFGEEVYALWTHWPVWAYAARDDVHGVTDATLPSGSPQLFDNATAGAFPIRQLWVDR